MRSNELKQFCQVRGSKSRNWIPPNSCIPRCKGTIGVVRFEYSSIPVQPLDPPRLTSVKASNPSLYNQGFKKPKSIIPDETLAESISAIIPANVGAAADVPETCFSMPRSMVVNSADCAETSGKPRPAGLKRPSHQSSSWCKYSGTFLSCHFGRENKSEKPPEEYITACSG